MNALVQLENCKRTSYTTNHKYHCGMQIKEFLAEDILTSVSLPAKMVVSFLANEGKIFQMSDINKSKGLCEKQLRIKSNIRED